MPAFSIASTSRSSMSLPALTRSSPVTGWLMSSSAVRPRTRMPSEATTWPASTIGCMVRPLSVPQSGVDDAVLRHVDETAGQVARVRRLQRGVGQALAGAVGRVEVLEHGQAFLEVRDDRRLDDLARRLGHQAAHAGELAHLGRRAAGAGVAHHVDRVHRLLAAVVVELDGLDAGHHLVGDLLRALGPGVDHLVVLLALGDQAVIVLLLVFLGERLGLGRRSGPCRPGSPCRPCRTRCRRGRHG